jgi:deoxycytidylate deaminase
MKRRVGAILVRSKRILSTGYNGTPRGVTNCNEGGCGRCNGSSRGGENSQFPFLFRYARVLVDTHTWMY